MNKTTLYIIRVLAVFVLIPTFWYAGYIGRIEAETGATLIHVLSLIALIPVNVLLCSLSFPMNTGRKVYGKPISVIEVPSQPDRICK